MPMNSDDYAQTPRILCLRLAARSDRPLEVETYRQDEGGRFQLEETSWEDYQRAKQRVRQFRQHGWVILRGLGVNL